MPGYEGGGKRIFYIYKWGGAEGNRENVLFNDVVCHKGSNCGLTIYYKLNLAIPRLLLISAVHGLMAE